MHWSNPTCHSVSANQPFKVATLHTITAENMIRLRFGLMALACMLLQVLPGSAEAAAITPQDPQAVVRETTTSVLTEIAAHKAELDADSARIYPIVEQYVVPHFDFVSMSHLALGRFWREATPGQQERLVSEFRQLLVRTYATTLLRYSGQKIEYPSMRQRAQDRTVTVPTRIDLAGSRTVAVDYSLMMNVSNQEWQVYDVVIDGISMVTSYRSSFARQIQGGAALESDPEKRTQSGIDRLIETLAKRNSDAHKATAAGSGDAS